MSHEAIAIALGLSRNTLEKHFERELSAGAFAKRFEALQGLHAAAKRGNVSAVKAYLAMPPEFMPLPADGAVAPAPQPNTPAIAQPLGKKEAANEAAKTAQHGTGWADILPTSLQ